jgi:hypothetical protein
VKVGLGILTCDREDYLKQVLRGWFGSCFDGPAFTNRLTVAVYNDGQPFPSESENVLGQEWTLAGPLYETFQSDPPYQGVAHGKNVLFRHLLDKGCDVVFLSEDDVVPLDSRAITGYIDAMEQSGWQHLSFAHHGPANNGGPVEGVESPPGVSYYPNYVGAWCCYTRKALEEGGLMEEGFSRFCLWDHVEHTLRLALHGFHPLPKAAGVLLAADATGSEDWLAEIPGSIENSAIIKRFGPTAPRVAASKAWWRENHPETFYLVFP